jgi:hypothetical protein
VSDVTSWQISLEKHTGQRSDIQQTFQAKCGFIISKPSRAQPASRHWILVVHLHPAIGFTSLLGLLAGGRIQVRLRSRVVGPSGRTVSDLTVEHYRMTCNAPVLVQRTSDDRTPQTIRTLLRIVRARYQSLW